MRMVKFADGTENQEILYLASLGQFYIRQFDFPIMVAKFKLKGFFYTFLSACFLLIFCL